MESTPAVDWERIEASPAFQELQAKRRRFVVPATAFFLTWYLGFIVLAGYAEDFFGESVHEGLTVGYVWALTQFLMVAVLGVAYLRYARTTLDPLRERALREAGADPSAAQTPGERFERGTVRVADEHREVTP
ncbi:DUF485 domain-containing protein [Conexibacter sp. SYSU D00693]|uniref:DUF485 domain-containing protein n=1 Tax=Conexibacter sp. SYSU D00693 TaxID=2812560 RepID=UPI00196AD633|nr:DUF485 domain-containing protein [Conexibacter sp. SYSU D00693]